jgi:hypothetical protein
MNVMAAFRDLTGDSFFPELHPVDRGTLALYKHGVPRSDIAKLVVEPEDRVAATIATYVG